MPDTYVKLGYLNVVKKRRTQAVNILEHAIKLLYQEARLKEIPKIQAQVKALKKEVKNLPWWKNIICSY